MPSVLVTACALLGLLVGSFLNVVIARVPADESVVRPGSRCPGCGAAIAARDNVPVVSWLLLRGRARCCGTRISPLYPAVELGTAVAFGLVAAWATGGSGDADRAGVLQPAGWGSLWPLPAFLFLAAVSIALFVIDLQHLRLPFWIVVPSWWVGAVLLGGAALLVGRPDAAVRMLLGGVAYWAFFRLMYALSRGKLGYGDVRLAGLLGLYLAWVSWGSLVLGAYLGLFVGGLVFIGLFVVRLVGRKTELPYGPTMIVGAWLGLVWGQQIADAYLNRMT